MLYEFFVFFRRYLIYPFIEFSYLSFSFNIFEWARFRSGTVFMETILYPDLASLCGSLDLVTDLPYGSKPFTCFQPSRFYLSYFLISLFFSCTLNLFCCPIMFFLFSFFIRLSPYLSLSYSTYFCPSFRFLYKKSVYRTVAVKFILL